MEVERVQAIASFSIPADTIPAEFIRPETEQPGITTYHGPVPEIPTVDFGDPDQENLVRMVSDASREWGLFQIVNHGIPNEVIEKLQKVGREFFELPQEEKETVARKPGVNSFTIEGYGTNLKKGDEKKSWVDFLFHNIWPASRVNYQFWPKNPPAYREANEIYAQHLKGVVDKLLKTISQGLGLEGNAIKDAVGGEELEYLLKINYYPPCPRPDLTLGVPAHTDMSVVTVLVPNEVPGLQVFKDDRWFDAKYIPNALIIHIGDQIEILSNGKYKSVLHRTTVNKEKTRMSWPVFCSPPAEMVIGPLPQLVIEDSPSKEANEIYTQHLKGVVDKLLKTISQGLGLEGNAIKDVVGGEELEYLLKINYYPPCPRPDLTLGVPAHTDMSVVTVLVPNEVPGLQVFKDDRWFDAKYIPNALIIHIGDQIEILSNGKYKSALHRTTMNKEKTRMSWPVFCSPPTEIGPLPQLVIEDSHSKYKTKKYKDYEYCKINKLPH
ncbi:hypothetical protein NE237_024040 [Protea cynaroides]|uniref:Fe2OG dioxygenase domain-containing protein n=1 Tax=Protea cynaroides TaxID=273540 RepID=A0A9Q0HCM0_9MAGN|nr:hypothetical protein NE237_024040 [Protea cynaroides]